MVFVCFQRFKCGQNTQRTVKAPTVWLSIYMRAATDRRFLYRCASPTDKHIANTIKFGSKTALTCPAVNQTMCLDVTLVQRQAMHTARVGRTNTRQLHMTLPYTLSIDFWKRQIVLYHGKHPSLR